MIPTDTDPEGAMRHNKALENALLQGEIEQRRQGCMWGGPKCWNVAGCSEAQRCTMGGVCAEMPNPNR